MAKKQRKYDIEYKIQAVKLAKELGGAKAASELGIPENITFEKNTRRCLKNKYCTKPEYRIS